MSSFGQKLALELVTAPTVKPVTLTQSKNHLRVDGTSEDSLISDLISSVTDMVEQYLSMALITQTWDMWLDQFPMEKNGNEPWWDGVREVPISVLTPNVLRQISVPKLPLQSVTTFTTYNCNDVSSVFTGYRVDNHSNRRPGRIVLKEAQTWPTDIRDSSGIQIRFVAGYGASGSFVPFDIKQAMLLTIAEWYENREPCTELPKSAIEILKTRRVIRS